MIYLDNAATTLRKPESVTRAVERSLRELGSPGRGGHAAAMAAAEEAYACRKLASALFHAPGPESVVFCMNATHALNLAIKSFSGKKNRVVITGYEHNAVLRPLHSMGAEVRAAASPLFQPERALEAFQRELKAGATLAVVNHVSNVFGYIQPLTELAALCRQYGVPLIVDASQSAGVLEIDVEKLGAAFVAMPGHKGLYGPQGTGLLLCAHPAKPLIEGGSGSDSRNLRMPDLLPERLEAGTLNMPGIAGLRAGLEFIRKTGTERLLRRERELLALAARLLGENPRLRLYLSPDPAYQTGVLSFTVRDMDCETAAAKLSDGGFAVRAGLHCAPLAHDTAGSGGTVRLSFGAFNTAAEVRKLARFLEKLQ